eukprot:6579673-Prymnesium_polylepis.1
MEEREYGVRFRALFLHFEMQLTLDKIHRIRVQGFQPFIESTRRQGAHARPLQEAAAHQGAAHRTAASQDPGR